MIRMTLRIVAMLAAAAVFLAACNPDEIAEWATVVAVQEAEANEPAEEPVLHYDDLTIPEVGWQIDLRLDDGSVASVTRKGGPRHEPGERVRVLKRDDGELLL